MQRKADMALSRPPRFSPDELVMQPWFLPHRVAFAIRSLSPPDYRHKMRHFFDDYGCMICKQDHDYGSNGMCRRCCMAVRKRLARSVRMHSRHKSKRRFDLGLIRQAKLAQKLLRAFPNADRGPTYSLNRGLDGFRPMNPIDEALGPHSLRVPR